ncbi:mechanosensitive ion channel domain-containing protein [Candidatus Nephthysia bennettiae]|uniref:Mechanosensitive ion channel n=1 Tax=Candidatus Nephthysia bennettiae TaxID=3127016 RepID=A0A934KCF6_9BACT|nr:mechanosensitive ion channel [Candidatus Dormibacteraeota bacterium]MBJ7612271.1 mechanosensitive ion channel [Candidatus Dormibacteraeota bacterium]
MVQSTILGLREQDVLAWLLDRGLNVLEGLVAFLVVLVLAHFVRRLASRVMARENVRTDVAVLVARAIYVGLVALGVFLFVTIALGNAAVGLTGILVAVFVTSLGLQDLFKNYVSGFYIGMERTVKIGDLLESGGYKGVVTEVAMRVTYMRGEEGQRIVVPNSKLFTETLSVSKAPDGWGSAGKGALDDASEGLESVRR